MHSPIPETADDIDENDIVLSDESDDDRRCGCRHHNAIRVHVRLNCTHGVRVRGRRRAPTRGLTRQRGYGEMVREVETVLRVQSGLTHSVIVPCVHPCSRQMTTGKGWTLG